MQLDRYIDSLISITNSANLPHPFRIQVISGFQYFKNQALSDLDRRDSPKVLKQRIEEFDKLLSSTTIFKQDRDAIRQNFGQGLALVPGSPVQPKAETSMFSNYNEEQLFHHLTAKVTRVGAVSELEKNMAYVCALYLQIVARMGKVKRNTSIDREVRQVWRIGQPIFKKMGLLEDYRRDRLAMRKIKSFISNP